MSRIEIYTKSWCPYCALAKTLLKKRGYQFEEIDITNDITREKEMRNRTNRTSVPQIFINGTSLGGYDDLHALDKAGRLGELMNAA